MSKKDVKIVKRKMWAYILGKDEVAVQSYLGTSCANDACNLLIALCVFFFVDLKIYIYRTLGIDQKRENILCNSLCRMWLRTCLVARCWCKRKCKLKLSESTLCYVLNALSSTTFLCNFALLSVASCSIWFSIYLLTARVKLFPLLTPTFLIVICSVQHSICGIIIIVEIERMTRWKCRKGRCNLSASARWREWYFLWGHKP